MTKILAVDQSITCTAWCIFEGEMFDVTSFGCIKTKPDEGDLFFRVNKITDVVKRLNKQVDTVVREGLGFGGSKSNASRDLAYLVGALEISAERPFVAYAPTSIKKFATGSGKATKEEMINSLSPHILDRFKAENYKKTTGLGDLADAYWIGMLHIHKMKEKQC